MTIFVANYFINNFNVIKLNTCEVKFLKSLINFFLKIHQGGIIIFAMISI